MAGQQSIGVNIEKPLFLRLLPDAFAFGLCLALAIFLRWDTTDLVWSLWLSSLILGYLTFFSAFLGGVYYVLRQKAFPEDRGVTDILLSIGIGVFFLGFFTIHFGGFHAIHATLLNGFFPLEGLPEREFRNAFFNPFLLWTLVLRHLVMPYGLFLITMIISERQHVFHHLFKGVRAAHGASVPVAQAAGGTKKVFAKESNLLADIVMRPYINVIRMHLLIFFFAFSYAIGIDGFFIMAVVYAVYFFPFNKVKKDFMEVIQAAILLGLMAMAAIVIQQVAGPLVPDSPAGVQRVEALEIARDGPFVAYSNDTVLDTRTNLMWAARDNGDSISWHGARRYCETFRVGGYTDWRMPTRDELAGLYDKSKGYTFGRQTQWSVYLTDLIQLSSHSVWASERSGSDAFRLNFIYGTISDIGTSGEGLRIRVLPVRSKD